MKLENVMPSANAPAAVATAVDSHSVPSTHPPPQVDSHSEQSTFHSGHHVKAALEGVTSEHHTVHEESVTENKEKDVK